ncbi:hypothetical protein MTN95_04745 [Bacillus sp. 2CMS4F]|uniref:hypothetical protein n=1 Tax=Bacillus sp. 2CMS4F TaxID=2929170 RepID=UPI0020BDEA77|nr:hypothetical protein [Bacillus sp. 2CMS4F]MCK8098701.1 hypothetical protein [Bacillus sp. 2CMS4F]
MKTYVLRFDMRSGKDESVTIQSESEKAMLEEVFEDGNTFTFVIENITKVIFLDHVETFTYYETKDPDILNSFK